MLGRICIAKTTLWRVTAEDEDILGLRLLKVTIPPTGRRLQLHTAARLLVKNRVGRVLVPEHFAHWALLGRYGLSPVGTEDFCRGMAAPLALAGLQRLEIPEEAATVVLRGERVTRAMRLAALALCPRVRGVIVTAHAGGEALQAELRREYGVPSLEESWGRAPDVAVHFSEFHGGGRLLLRLYGPEPDLAGLSICCRRESLPKDCEPMPLMAALWETGKLRGDDSDIFSET